MFYALLNPDGSLKQYPYTITDLKRANPGTSWPKVVSDEVAAGFNVYRVTPTQQPQVDHTVNLSRTAAKVNGVWAEEWVQTPATAEEITQRTDAKAAEARIQRDQLLRDSDWVVVQEQELAAREPRPRAAAFNRPINNYRQALRDITSQPGFPHNITWPDKP